MEIFKKKKGKAENVETSAYFLVDYDTESGSNIKLFYHIGNDDGEYVKDVSYDDIPKKEKVYRVSKNDNVLLFTKQHAKRTSKKKAFMKAANGKPAYISGLRKDESYITNNQSVKLDNGNRVSPLNILVDKYLKDKKLLGRTGHQTVISLFIRGENNVILSWLKSPIGEYVKDAYSVLIMDEINDEDELKLSVFDSFKAKTGIALNENDDSIHYEIITEIELLDYIEDGKKDLYPIDDEFLKIRKDIVSLIMFSITASVAGSSFVIAETLSNKETKLIKEHREIKNSKPDVDAYKKDKIKNHVSFFIESRNIDFLDALESSELVWLNNSRVELIADKNDTIIRLFSTKSPSYIPHAFIDLIHEQEAPEGYIKEEIISYDNYESFEVVYKKDKQVNYNGK